jgi:Asp-tRNA(Asn)/Glu-tRNA(Gln) amidotransferase A subunit family amidase
MSNELYRLTATEAVRQIDAEILKPADLMEACLERIAGREPIIHAFAFHDPSAVRAAMPGPGKLRGIPIGVKDVLDTGDMPAQYGSPIWSGWRPRADSAPVASTREAGSVVIGKTVTTELTPLLLLAGGTRPDSHVVGGVR